MPDVAFILPPRALWTGLTMPAEMFRAADELYRVRRRARPRLRLTLATTDDRRVGWMSALEATPHRRLDRIERADLLYLAPFWRRPDIDVPAALAAVRRLAEGGSLVCAVSTGAYLLAAAGLLDGRAATTHWSFLDDFASRFPAVELKRQHLITRAGDLYCAGSLNATADLTAHLIERLYDAAVARGVEDHFSPEIRRPAAQQGFFDGEIGPQPDELMAEAQQRLRQRCEGPVDLEALAAELGISRRTLNRRFREATGRTPVRFVQQARIERASALLRNTNLGIAEIAARVGYDDPAHFATLYRRLAGRTPTVYRAAVRAKLFSPE